MKSFNEWMFFKENLSSKILTKFTLKGAGGQFKLNIESVDQNQNNGWIEINLRGKAILTGVATSALGRTNYTLGGMNNKKIIRRDSDGENYDQDVRGYEPAAEGIEKPGTIQARFYIEDFDRKPSGPNGMMYFNSEWTNWQTREIESIDKGSALLIVDLANQELKPKQIDISNLEFHQKIS